MLEYDETSVAWWIEWFEECWNVKLHPNAHTLIDDIEIWNGNNGISLGVDEDDEDFSIMSEEYHKNASVSFYDTIANLEFLNRNFQDFYITDKERIIEIENSFQGHYTHSRYFDTDYFLINYALGQLMLQGYIESRLKDIAFIAVARQKSTESLWITDEMLDKIRFIIQEAPNTVGIKL